VYNDKQRQFLQAHRWGILATGRADGSPQQAMVGYRLDDSGRVLILTQSFTAKWRNALRQPKVSFAVADDRTHVVIYGLAEAIENDPMRAELTADVLEVVRGEGRPDPDSLAAWLDENQRTILRITPQKVLLHE
jgi:PPOX class probable F420-dependent enzyme